MINSWPFYDNSQIDSVVRVLKSGCVNTWTGSETNCFENEFSKWCGASRSIAVSNGSLALSLAYLALKFSSSDEIITTPRTFVATASSAVLLGAKPIFADVDENSGCITAETIEPLINSRTKGICIVHHGGWPAEMESICSLATAHDIKVVEDCAQAHGARILIDGKWQSVGTFGDISAWSFCQDKIMSTGGEGGMVTTSSEEYFDLMWSFKDHGKTRQAVFEREHAPGFRWLHERFGSNFRLTELQSAIGRIQLQQMPEWKKLRSQNAQTLINLLAKCKVVRIPIPSETLEHAWYKFHCYVNLDALKSDWSRDRIVAEISALGYPAFHGSCSEIYLEKCFKLAGLTPSERLPVAKKLGQTSLMFLVHPTITTEQMIRYGEVILTVLKKASL